jgi:hypothetical protein
LPAHSAASGCRSIFSALARVEPLDAPFLVSETAYATSLPARSKSSICWSFAVYCRATQAPDSALSA